MFTMSKETYEMIKGMCDGQHEQQLAAGRLVPSRLNRLLWSDGSDTFRLPDFTFDDEAIISPSTHEHHLRLPDTSNDPTMPLDSTFDCEHLLLSSLNELLDTPDSSSGYSSPYARSTGSEPSSVGTGASAEAYERVEMAKTWKLLRVIDRECEYCRNHAPNCESYPRHNLYAANGMLACPVVVAGFCNACGRRGHTIEFCKKNVNAVRDYKEESLQANCNARGNLWNGQY